MIAPLAKFIDWSALQMAFVVAPLRHAPRPKWKLEEALEFLNGPDFIPAAGDPARIEFTRAALSTRGAQKQIPISLFMRHLAGLLAALLVLGGYAPASAQEKS